MSGPLSAKEMVLKIIGRMVLSGISSIAKTGLPSEFGDTVTMPTHLLTASASHKPPKSQAEISRMVHHQFAGALALLYIRVHDPKPPAQICYQYHQCNALASGM